MTYDIKVHTKQRYMIEFHCREEIPPANIHQHLLNDYREEMWI